MRRLDGAPPGKTTSAAASASRSSRARTAALGLASKDPPGLKRAPAPRSIRVAVPPLAERIVQLLDDEVLRARLGQAGRRRVEEHFEFEACTRQIVELLEGTMRR